MGIRAVFPLIMYFVCLCAVVVPALKSVVVLPPLEADTVCMVLGKSFDFERYADRYPHNIRIYGRIICFDDIDDIELTPMKPII